MPNTLGHIGAQALASKAIWRDPDLKWIGLACVIPDFPWIIQRLAPTCIPSIDRIDLRLYCMVQATLLFSLVLAGAISVLARPGRRIFVLLGVNVAFHLLLDSLQIKWANGIHLLAPLSWHLTGIGLFWPEDTPSLVLTLAGVVCLLWYGRRDAGKPVLFCCRPWRISLCLVLLACYLLLPLVLLDEPLQANNHFTATLSKNAAARPGCFLEVDRCHYQAKTGTIRIFSGETLRITGDLPPQDGFISLQGHFTNNHTVAVTALHVHSSLRDQASMAGLLGIFLLWMLALLKKKIKLRLK